MRRRGEADKHVLMVESTRIDSWLVKFKGKGDLYYKYIVKYASLAGLMKRRRLKIYGWMSI